VNKYIGIKLQLIPFSHTPYSKYKGKWCRAIYPSQMMHKQPEKKKGVLFAEEPQQQSVEMTSLQVGRSRLVLKLLPFKAADSIGCCE
jgi:hypothetical protein